MNLQGMKQRAILILVMSAIMICSTALIAEAGFRQIFSPDGEAIIIFENDSPIAAPQNNIIPVNNVVKPANNVIANNNKSFGGLSKLGLIACKYLNSPYRYGGTSPKGFDCSGFTQYVFSQAGIKIPRTSDDQRHYIASRGGRRGTDFRNIPTNALLFRNGKGQGGHVALYLGNGVVIEASTASTGVIKRTQSPEKLASRFSSWGVVPGSENL